MDIKAEVRKVKGKKVRKLRRQGTIPASISLLNNDTLLIQLDVKEANRIKKLKQIEKINIDVDGKKHVTLVSEFVTDPINNQILHISFTEVGPKSHINIFVPIRIKGISPAVKNNIGVLLRNLSSVRLVFNSENVVPYLEVDVSNLENVGDRILFTEELLPEGVKPASFKDFGQTIVTIRPPQKVVKVTTTVEGEEGTELEEGAEEGGATEGEATEASTSEQADSN